MIPLLTAPWALAALATIPALAALYWLRNSWREVPVSSLMLWLHETRTQASGLRMRRLETPLLFFLEIAALALLALAATGPRLDTGQGRWPLVVVLDDSFSMLAGGDDAPRRLAQATLEREVRWGESHPVRFVLAGDVPQALGDSLQSWTQAHQALEGWRCRSASARLAEAIVFAGELSGEKARVLVVSDRGPEQDPGAGRVRWWAFGQARPNIGIVSAARSAREGQERCLLEIANFAPRPQQTTLILDADAAGQELHRSVIKLDPQEIGRVLLRLPRAVPVVRARIEEDALAFDNQVTLVREETLPVRVEVRLKNELLRTAMEKALQATGKTAPPGERPELVVTDEPTAEPTAPESWIVQVLAEKEAESYVGPFVLDRTHPLTEGISLAGIVWGAGSSRDLPGAPVVLAGSVPLITDAAGLAGHHHVRVRLRPDLATLVESPAWPILIWNLVQWRGAEAPGVRPANLRLGDTATLKAPLGVESVVHAPPTGGTRLFPVQAQRVSIRAEEPGLHRVEAGAGTHLFAVNPLARDESDLTTRATGRWGEWTEETSTAPTLVSLAWIPMLLVLGVLTLHMVLARGSGR